MSIENAISLAKRTIIYACCCTRSKRIRRYSSTTKYPTIIIETLFGIQRSFVRNVDRESSSIWKCPLVYCLLPRTCFKYNPLEMNYSTSVYSLTRNRVASYLIANENRHLAFQSNEFFANYGRRLRFAAEIANCSNAVPRRDLCALALRRGTAGV